MVKYAKDRGCLARKMNGLGFSGWPDRLFITPTGNVFWVEFKRPGNVLSAGQETVIGDLTKRGHMVYIVDNVPQGKATVEAELGRRVGG